MIESESISENSENSENTSESSDGDIDTCDNLELTGEIIRNYNVIYELGRGAYSIVWLVYSIVNNRYYALKVQNPDDFQEGMQEVLFIKRLPKELNVYNHIIEYFIEIKNNKKYLCSIWELHCYSVDTLLRKSSYKLSILHIKNIMKQLIKGIVHLHKKLKVFHGDIKTDNILIKGINNKDNFFISEYSKLLNSNIINKQNNELRLQEHKKNLNIIIDKYNSELYSKYETNSKYIDNINISLADFGTFCEESKCYTNSFGTRYYLAPEIILMGKCSYPVDIWALGCTFYELLSGNLLFDPIKDSNYDRNHYHLCLINDTCGHFPSSFLKSTSRYKNYFNNKLVLPEHHNTSNDRLIKKLNQINLSKDDYNNVYRLLKSMLTIDPNKRITIDKLVNDTWLIN
jgi:serine/threonine-protein kinase SRPK3